MNTEFLGFEDRECLRVEFTLYSHPNGQHEQTPLIVRTFICDENFYCSLKPPGDRECSRNIDAMITMPV